MTNLANSISDLVTQLYAETGVVPSTLVLPSRDFDRLLADAECTIPVTCSYLPGTVPTTDSLRLIHLGGILEVRRERPLRLAAPTKEVFSPSVAVEIEAYPATPAERTATERERFIFDAEADGASLVFRFGNGYRPVPTANYIDEWDEHVPTLLGIGPG